MHNSKTTYIKKRKEYSLILLRFYINLGKVQVICFDVYKSANKIKFGFYSTLSCLELSRMWGYGPSAPVLEVC